MQWQWWPVPTDTAGTPAIHDTTVSNGFAQGADEGALWQAGIARVRPRAAEQPRASSVLHGDGTNTGAQKGGRALGTRATTPFDSAPNRQMICTAGMSPNIKEHPRHRTATKRGRKRLCNDAIHALRMRVERTFAWAEKCKRLLLRLEYIQQRHSGMQLMAYTMSHLPVFWGA
jgi:hypothetical protein